MRTAVAQRRPGLIVLDVMMPREDGLSAAQALAGKRGLPASIMLSAPANDTERTLGLGVGTADTWQRPCNPHLSARVRPLVRRSQASNALADLRGNANEVAGGRLGRGGPRPARAHQHLHRSVRWRIRAAAHRLISGCELVSGNSRQRIHAAPPPDRHMLLGCAADDKLRLPAVLDRVLRTRMQARTWPSLMAVPRLPQVIGA